MRHFFEIIITVIGLMTLFSCSYHDKENISGVVVFERGKIHDSVTNNLDYYTYSQVIDKYGTKHIYKLDSTFFNNDSTFIKDEQNDNKHNKRVYFQSQHMDTLYFKYYENDTVLTFSELYELLDSVKINISNQDFMLYRYDLPMPPCDGDLTLFFNKDIGLIEEYNRGWGGRRSIKKYLCNNQISTIISKLRCLGDFYFFVFPPPPLPTENEINNKSFD